MVGEQVASRELLFRITQRDLMLRYKQTVMGVGWAIVMPLVNTAIFSVIFTRVAPIDTGMPYPLYAYSGLLAWNLFASSLRFASTSLTSNSTLVTKISFPREILPISSVLVTLVDSIVGAAVLAAMMAYYHVGIAPAILLLPLLIAIELAFTCAVALLLSMANLFYRDVKYLLEFLITVWMFGTSVVYPVELIDGRLGAALRLNPMVPIINGFRTVLIRGEVPDLVPLAASGVVAIVALVVAWATFHQAEFRFAENI